METRKLDVYTTMVLFIELYKHGANYVRLQFENSNDDHYYIVIENEDLKKNKVESFDLKEIQRIVNEKVAKRNLPLIEFENQKEVDNKTIITFKDIIGG